MYLNTAYFFLFERLFPSFIEVTDHEPRGYVTGIFFLSTG